MSLKQMPARSIVLTLSENRQFKVEFPKTGQLIDIESRKISISRNTYDGLLMSATNDSLYARFLIDTIATFEVIIPKLKDQLTVKSLFDLDLLQSKELIECYLKQYLPWYKQWMDIVNGVEEETDKKDDEQQQ